MLGSAAIATFMAKVSAPKIPKSRISFNVSGFLAKGIHQLKGIAVVDGGGVGTGSGIFFP